MMYGKIHGWMGTGGGYSEDLTDELVALDPKKGYTVDDWMEKVAFPYIKKNHK